MGLGLLLLQCAAQADDSVIEMIALRNRPAAEIQALLVPMLEANEVVSGDGFNLIVKASPQRLATFRGLIDQLDTRPHNLLISVMQNSHQSADQLNAEAAIQLSGQSIRMRGMSGDTRNLEQQRTTQQLRTLEGQAAHIQAGNSRPVENIGVYGNAYGYAGITSNTYMQEASTGFAVVPRLIGNDEVMVDIEPWSDRFTHNGAVETRNLRTSVRGRLGEWLEIGGVEEQRQTDRQGFNGLNYSTRNRNQGTLIKIDLAD
ncbi:type II and III secretion system protein [Methylomonas rivi]|uniref:Type II and III secretion system protein n=1 Tax=Methylomonas rivi TaxID=2952226 RepID=A0ABT1U4E9_9GAMM|nr:type II and III secretion system protein [Methylomonas sp. WSC-6]